MKYYRANFIAVLLLAMLSAQTALAEDEAAVGPWIVDESDMEQYLDSDSDIEGNGQKKSRRFSGLKGYQKKFKDFCTALEQDGRKELLYSVVKEHSSSSNPCDSCRTLFKLIERSCKPPRQNSRRKKKEEVVPPGPPRQRVPAPAVVDLGGSLFQEIFEEEEDRPRTVAALKSFASILENGKDLSPAAREYAEMLALLVKSPLETYLKQQRMKELEEERRQQELLTGNSTFKVSPSQLDDAFGVEEQE